MSQPAAPPPATSPQSELPGWQPFFVAGEYRRALAAARLEQASVLDSLEALFDVQEALRGRQYDQAQKQLTRLAEELERCASPEQATLRAQLDPERLRAAVQALQGVYTPYSPVPQGTPQQLQFQLQPALQEALTRAEACNVLGLAHAQAGAIAEASAHFEAALQADPQHYRALSNLGNMALEQGRLDDAEQMQRAAIALNSDFASAHHNLGVVLRKKGQLTQSVSHIRRGQRLSQRQAMQERPDGVPSWMTPHNMRLLGVALAVLAFVLVLFRHHQGS